MPYSDTKVLSVSRPLYANDNNVIGVLRYSSSLEPAIHSVWTLSRYLLLLTAFVIAIAVVASRMLAKSITRPIEEIQSTAIQLADGQYKNTLS